MAIRVNPKKGESTDFRTAMAVVVALAQIAVNEGAAESRSGQPDPTDQAAVDQVAAAFGFNDTNPIEVVR